jgi:hypothetical protein
MLTMRQIVAAFLALACSSGFAQELEPGEWEFVSTSTSGLFQGPQTASFKRCIRKEEAANPDQWMGKPDPQGECKLTPVKKTANTYAWDMECPKANMRGSGIARMSRTTMEGETHMTGEVQGRKFDLRTKVAGKRLGPCKN